MLCNHLLRPSRHRRLPKEILLNLKASGDDNQMQRENNFLSSAPSAPKLTFSGESESRQLSWTWDVGEWKEAEGSFGPSEADTQPLHDYRAMMERITDSLSLLLLDHMRTFGSVKATLTQAQFNLALTGIDD